MSARVGVQHPHGIVGYGVVSRHRALVAQHSRLVYQSDAIPTRPHDNAIIVHDTIVTILQNDL